jgi:hypothetical protein
VPGTRPVVCSGKNWREMVHSLWHLPRPTVRRTEWVWAQSRTNSCGAWWRGREGHGLQMERDQRDGDRSKPIRWKSRRAPRAATQPPELAERWQLERDV